MDDAGRREGKTPVSRTDRAFRDVDVIVEDGYEVQRLRGKDGEAAARSAAQITT